MPSCGDPKYQAIGGSPSGKHSDCETNYVPMLRDRQHETKPFFFTRPCSGFKTMMTSPEYAIVERDGLTIHLQKAEDEETHEVHARAY